MSDAKIAEFRERAERGLDWPELGVLEGRARMRRRRRAAGAVGALALVLAAGAGAATKLTEVSDGAGSVSVPAGSTSPTTASNAQPGVRTAYDRGEDLLLPGRSEARYEGATVRFDVPGGGWEWWDSGLGLRKGADDPDDYAGAVFFLADASARVGRCGDDAVRKLGADPDNLVANVAPLVDMARTQVLQPPHVVSAFGGSAVHVRVETVGACPDSAGLPMLVRGQLNGSDFDPGFGGRHVVDVWHRVLPGDPASTVTVVSWDLGGTGAQRLQQQSVLDSLRISPPA